MSTLNSHGSTNTRDELKYIDLESKSIPKLLISYSITTFMGLFLSSIYSITDALFVGHGIGIDALGAISAVLPFTIVQGAISATIGGGASVIISRLIGAKDYKKSGEIVVNCAVFFWLVSIIISVVGLVFIDELVIVLGVADNLDDYARRYLIIILIGNVFSTGFSSIMRAEGKMVYSLFQWIIPISINICLDATFVFGMGMSVEGVAWATVISQVFGFVMSAFYFIRISKFDYKGARLNVNNILNITKNGLPSLLQQAIISATLIALNWVMVTVGGSNMQTVFGILNKLFMLGIVPVVAITQALQPIAGYNYGAGNGCRVKSVLNWSIFISLIMSILSLGVYECIPSYLIRIFTDDYLVIEECVYALKIIATSLPLLFLPSVVGAIAQSIGKKVLAIFMFASNYMFVPPLAILIFNLCGQPYIWYSFVIAGAIASVISILPLVHVYKVLRRC